MENPKQKPTRSQIHPSILTQPLINKEKEKEKELRDKERGNTSKKQVYTIELTNQKLIILLILLQIILLIIKQNKL